MRRLTLILPPLFFFGAVLLAFRIIRGQPLGLLGITLVVLFGGGLGWVLISTLWPARADRGCPECGADRLERLDPAGSVGVRCGACGWRDETRSAWLLAEEEGPLEDLVMRQRGREPARSSESAVDTPPAAD